MLNILLALPVYKIYNIVKDAIGFIPAPNKGDNRNETNTDFLEEYKRLDKLCRDIYRSDNGISNYIDEMSQISTFTTKRIPNWSADLQQLITMRHIRNQLSHDVGTMDVAMCSLDDIDWLKEFHHRILAQEDPLTRYRIVCSPNDNLQIQEKQPLKKVNVTSRRSLSLLYLIIPVLFLLIFIAVIYGAIYLFYH